LRAAAGGTVPKAEVAAQSRRHLRVPARSYVKAAEYTDGRRGRKGGESAPFARAYNRRPAGRPPAGQSGGGRFRAM